jgi:hypothetical protein
LENLTGKDNLADLGVDVRIILSLMLRKYGMDFIHLRPLQAITEVDGIKHL